MAQRIEQDLIVPGQVLAPPGFEPGWTKPAAPPPPPPVADAVSDTETAVAIHPTVLRLRRTGREGAERPQPPPPDKPPASGGAADAQRQSTVRLTVFSPEAGTPPLVTNITGVSYDRRRKIYAFLDAVADLEPVPTAVVFALANPFTYRVVVEEHRGWTMMAAAVRRK
jgi:hypothetical protein